jgi:myosin-1
VPWTDSRSDAQEFDDVVRALDVIGIRESCRHDMFRVLLAIITIGNISISEIDGVAHPESTDESRAALENGALLLGVPSGAFAAKLIVKIVSAGRESVEKPLSRDEATEVKEGLAKDLLQRLFNFIVQSVNSGVASRGTGAVLRTIGILDIFGFETGRNRNGVQGAHLNPLGHFLNPLGLFLRTSILFIRRIMSAFLPA